jgi:hypothetical protein
MHHLARPFFVALVSIPFCGCGPSRIATYEVRGSVHVNGLSAAGVNVYFHPTDGSDEFRAQRPYAETDAHGRFRLKTFVQDDGAPAGTYRVTFTWFDAVQPMSVDSTDPERRTRRSVEDRLRGRYADLESTPFVVQVTAAPTELEPFELVTEF